MLHSSFRFLSFTLITALMASPAQAATPDSATSCSSAEILASFPSDTEVNASLDVAADAAAVGMCPNRWYCDETGHFYGTRAICQNACGATACYRDYDCNPGFPCICP